MENKIAEVIAAGSTGFTAECYELFHIPPLGSLVFTVNPPLEIIGVVCEAKTEGIEPGRKPAARGKDEATDEAVYRTSPQLAKLLRSEFTAVVIGHKNGDKIYPYLPPRPARLHGFVYPGPTETVKSFGDSLDFLSLLANADTATPAEELTAAVLREMSRVQTDPAAFLLKAGKKLTTIYSGDYAKLKAVLGRLSL